MSVELLPIEGIPEIRAGDDLGAILANAVGRHDLTSTDVLVVTSKIVSKAEGRVVRADREEVIRSQTRSVVARRGDLVIARTSHGFVCANAGVDESNVGEGALALLPEDPDASADRIREGLRERLRVEPAVVVSDTFGRPWRTGLVNVAIGCAGLPALVDIRGTPDHTGRTLEATIIAFADEVVAAAGLVMPKAGRVPAALVRGLRWEAPPGRARDLVRSSEEDLFPWGPLEAISARRTATAFGPGEVDRATIQDAVAAACTAPAPHGARPWLFVALEDAEARRGLMDAMTTAWRRDLIRDGTAEETIRRRLKRSDEILGAAAALVIPCVTFAASRRYEDADRRQSEREMFLLSGGAAIQNLLLALSAQGLGSTWIGSTLFCREETRSALNLTDEWFPLGAVVVGRMPEGAASPRPRLELSDHLRFG